MKAPTLKPKGRIYLREETANWQTIEDVERAVKGKGVILKGKTLDLNGWQLDGSKLPKTGSGQDEGSFPLRIRISGFTLKNGSFEKIAGGLIVIADKVSLLSLICTRIGEDGISNIVDRAENLTVKGCQLYGGSDKSYQINDARGLTFVGNLAAGGETGARIQESKTKIKDIRTKLVKDNAFYDVPTAWNVSGGAHVVTSGNKYSGVRERWVLSHGATYSEK